MRKQLLLLSVLCFTGLHAFSQNGNFRSRITGNWNVAGTWERDADSNGTYEETPSTLVPASTDGTIIVQNAHAVTVTAGVTVDQVTIQSGGTLTINSAITLTLASGTGNEITVDAGGILTNNGIIAFGGIPVRNVLVNGTLNNSGSFTGVSASKLTFGSGSNYFHQFANGGTIPAATWNSTSSVNIVGYTSGNSTAPSGLNQTFGHFVWNAPGQDVTITLGGLPTSINGDFRLESTGIDALYYSLGGAGNTMNIGGNFDINGGTLGWTSGDAAVSTLNITGNIDISGSSYVQFADDQNLTINLTGNFALSGTAQIDFSALTATTNLNIQGNYTHSGGDIFVNGGTGNINFTGASTKVFTSTLVPVGAVNYSVAALSTLSVPGSNFVGGGGTFTLNGTLQVGSGDAGGALQTGTANGNLRVSGTRTFASNSTIVYNGTSAQFIGNGFPSSGVVNLTINNSNNVTLSTSLDIVALSVLTLTSGNIVIGSQTLTINGTVSGSGGIVGGSTSNLVIGGTGNFGTLTFNSSNQLQNFTLNRTSSGLVTLGGSLTILGTFTHTAGTLAIGSNTFTISGAYGPAAPDVLSVTSSSIILIDGTGTLPSDVGFSGTDLGTLTLNRASTTLATTSSITITNLNLTSGTFSNGTGITMATGGTITRVGGASGGSMTTNPTNTTNSYNVVYTTGALTSGPELPSNTTALANLSKTGGGTLTLGSNITINSTLTLSSGSFNAGTNTIDLKGNFVSNAASTLTSSPVTFSGTTTISGSSTPTFGAITISGTLTPSSSFQVNGNLVNNGTLNAGSATTTFGGTTTISGTSTSSFNNLTISGTLTAPTGSMNVAGTFTNNGTFNRNGGTVVFNGTTSIAGTSTTDFSNITISGTLNAPATLNVTRNFTNNGTFNRGTGTVVFMGTATQSIQGSAVTDFNNITVTNTAGPPAVQVQSNQNLRGTLTLAANTIFDADGSAGTSVLTLISTADDPTSDAGIATLPIGASVTGSVTVQRYMAIEGTGSRMYRYISSPVQAPAASQIQSEIPITGTFTGTSTCSGCGTGQSMFQYDETVITGDLNSGYVDFPSTANTETLSTARGYSIYVRGNIDPVLTAGSARWDVRAPINSGTVAFPATFTSSGTPANDGWNLVGNPYPSTIDWDAASGWTRTNINNAIYMRDNGVGVVASYVGGVGSNGGTRYIGLGQGFFVQSTASPTFSATESVKVAGTQTTFFRENSINDILRITLRQGNTRDESVIRFIENATAEFDGNWDAYKLKNGTFNLSSMIPGDLKLAINALPKITCATAVNLDISNVSQGSYSIEFTEFESFSNEVEIYVNDLYTNTVINARETSSYAFDVTSDSSSFGNKRFSVLFSYKKPVEAQLNASPEICQGQQALINIENSETYVTYSLYKNGNVIIEPVAGNGGSLQIPVDASLLSTGDNEFILQYSPADCNSMLFKKTVNIKSFGILSVTPTSATHCGSGSVPLSATGAEAGSYRWYETADATAPIEGQTGAEFITPALDKTKTYYVSAINALGCEGERVAVAAEIINYDEVLIAVEGQNLVSSYASGNQWYLNGEPITGATGQSLEVKESGLYEVEVKVNGCSTRASREMIVTGIESSSSDGNGVKLHPNPVKELLFIELPQNLSADGEVRTSLGQPVGPIKFISSGDKMKGEYNFENHTPGLYLIRITQGNLIMNYKIIKK